MFVRLLAALCLLSSASSVSVNAQVEPPTLDPRHGTTRAEAFQIIDYTKRCETDAGPSTLEQNECHYQSALEIESQFWKVKMTVNELIAKDRDDARREGWDYVASLANQHYIAVTRMTNLFLGEWRSAVCAFESTAMLGGTGASVIYSGCWAYEMMQMTKRLDQNYSVYAALREQARQRGERFMKEGPQR